MSNAGENSPSAFDFKLFAESLRGDVRRIMDQKLEIVHEWLDKVKGVGTEGNQSKMNRIAPTIPTKTLDRKRGEPIRVQTTGRGDQRNQNASSDF